MSIGWNSVRCHERSRSGPEHCHRGRERNGRRIRPPLRARPPGRRTCNRYRTLEARHLAPQADGRSVSRLRGLLRTQGRALGSGRGRLLPGAYTGAVPWPQVVAVRRLRSWRRTRRDHVHADPDAKLNDVDPQAWLADVLARIADHKIARLADLLPWNWRLTPPGSGDLICSEQPVCPAAYSGWLPSNRTGMWIESYGQCVYFRTSGACRIKHRRARNFCDDVA
jgi:hypothetical protein